MNDAKRVDVVLINYMRPANVRAIVRAFREQTVPCHLSIIDAAAGPEFQLDQDCLDATDIVFRWNKNFGPYDRYVPVGAFFHEFTYFHDDDMLPGTRLLEHFLAAADSFPEFGVLGQQGRIVDSSGGYHPRKVERANTPVPVDIVVRGFFVRTSNLPAVIQQRHRFELIPGVELEDDLLLCTAMNMILGLTNYLTSFDSNIETKMNQSELSGTYARHERGNHVSVRSDFCRKAIAAGWVPLSHKLGYVETSPELTNSKSASKQATDVNAYWLERGKTYITEEHHRVLPYSLQEQFILSSLRSIGVPMRKVLEIGCGFGRITKRLAQDHQEATITAIDISPDQLHFARNFCAEYLDRIDFLEYDIQSGAPFPGGHFDTAIAVLALQHHPLEVVHPLLNALSSVADYVVNFDWSEPSYHGPIAPHVWNHDYLEIYESLGMECQVFAEPRKFFGQQHKLFVASRPNRGETHRVARRQLVDAGMSEHLEPIIGSREYQPQTTRFVYIVDESGSRRSYEFDFEGFNSEDHLFRQIDMYKSFYEKDLLDHLVARGPLGGVFIDVGANIGNHSVFFGKFLADFVVAFEPVPEVARILRRNLAVNGIANHLVIEKALGSRPGWGRLLLPPAQLHNVGSSRILLEEGTDSAVNPVAMVQVATLDQTMQQIDLRTGATSVSLVKIDTEGMEMEIIAGSTSLLDVHRPQLVVELATQNSFMEAATYLSRWGYRSVGRFCGTATYHFIVPSHHRLRDSSP